MFEYAKASSTTFNLVFVVVLPLSLVGYEPQDDCGLANEAASQNLVLE